MTEPNHLDHIVSKEAFTQGFNRQLYDFTYRIAKPFYTGKTCLEIGPAEGYALPHLAERFEHVTILDGSATLLKKLQNLFGAENTSFQQGMLETYDTSEQFDTILLGHVMEYIDKALPVLKKINRWLSPGGRLIVIGTNPNSLHRQAAVIMGLLENVTQLTPLTRQLGVKTIYTIKSMRNHLTEAGFTIEKEGGFFLKPISNRQIEEQWTPDMVEAYFELGKRYPHIAAEMFFVCRVKT